MSRRPWSRAAVVLPVALAVSAGSGAAYAVAQAKANGMQPVDPIATFGAQASTSATSSSQTGPLVLTYGLADIADRTFFVRGTGSLPVTAETWSIAVSNTGAAVKGSVDVVACSVAWTATGCSGTTTPVASVAEGGTATPTTSLPIAKGGAFGVKVVQSRKISQFTVTIGISVSRAQTLPGGQTTSA